MSFNPSSANKQLLDEVEHDIMNFQNRGLCYLPEPKAKADNTDTRSIAHSASPHGLLTRFGLRV